MSSLKSKTVSGVIWTGLESVGQYLIQFVITIILARILTPSDFGLIEMLLIFTALSRVIVDSGFSQALIREKNVNQLDHSSVFYFNIVLALFVYLILYFSAPLIAQFYNSPELVAVSRVIFLSVILNAFGVVPTAVISTELNFKVLTRASIFGAGFSALIGISMAKIGYGVWALVFQTVSFSFARTLMLWISNSWRPSFNFSLRPIRQLFRFSSRLLVVGVLDVIFTNLQSLLIGRLYSRSDLGFYAQAKRFQSVPSNTLTQVIQRVTYPVLSKIQDESERLKIAYKKVIKLAVFIIVPMMSGLLVTGDLIFLIVLTEKWLPAVDYFKPLCLVGALYPLYSINLNIITVKGEGDLFMRIGIAKRVIILIAIVLTIQFGVLALVWGQVVATLINSLITMYFSGRLIKYKMFEQLVDVMPTILLSALAAIVVYSMGIILPISDKYMMLFVQLLVGLVFYVFFAYILRFSAFFELLQIINSRIKTT